MSLYSEYIKERENRSTVEFDNAFFTYKIENQFVLAGDAYVRPDYRKLNIHTLLHVLLEYEAIKNNCKYIIASVSYLDKNFKKNIKIFRNLRYKYYSKNKTTKLIYIIKEL